MKFLNYLTEFSQTDIAEAYDILKRECKEALNLINKKRIVFDRWTDNYPESIIMARVKPRKDRKALDTPQEVSDAIDNELKKKFGWKPRSEGVFCWPRKIGAPSQVLGKAFCVFPVGNFKVVFATGNYEFRDLFSYLVDLYNSMTVTQYSFKAHYADQSPEFKKEFIKNVISDIKDVYTSDISKITGYSTETGEIMIKCKEYYLVNINVVNEIFK